MSAGALFAEEEGGGQNGASLAGLEAGFDPITFDTRQVDAHADITTNVTVSTCSDPGLEQVCIEAVSEGSAAYPDIEDVDWMSRFAQIPNAGGGFTESGTLHLIGADGSVIRSELSATYPDAFDLQTPQVRHVGLEVESESGD